MQKSNHKLLLWSIIISLGIVFFAGNCLADVIDKWINEFQPSALSKEEQRKELEWFQKAAAPYKGMKIKSCAEHISTHLFESEVLAKAFTEITGIEVEHDVIGEGDVVERMQTQIASGKTIYHAYVNDADIVGTHLRKETAVVLNKYMEGEGKAVTNPLSGLSRRLSEPRIRDGLRRQHPADSGSAVSDSVLVPLRPVHRSQLYEAVQGYIRV